ncbi:cupin domain-containing protein [Streptomyces dysideae]|uniref:Cupin n=1 Tax=Streptomyces dysideae TaxID=909626 RepID=A0A101UR28_9ACTN|nr:cupin domain-containing protein [Streptomyces dysideae]KUO15325.1 cupin [Streptomyces dysideae]
MRDMHAAKVGTQDITSDRRRGADLRVLLSPRTVGATKGMLGVVALRPGEFVSEHYHPYSEEFLYVVEGEVVVRLDDEPVPLAADESLLVPVDVRHRVENNGGRPARVVFALSGLAPRPELGHVDTEPQPAADTEPWLADAPDPGSAAGGGQ